MKSIKIIATGKYLPETKIDNYYLARKLGTTQDYIYKRTGIQTRYYSKENNIEELAIKSVENLINKNSKINIKNIDMIIVATTSTNMLMPGISYKIQAHFNINDCICLDILAGCAGFVNALDIAQSYITTNKAKTALIVGTEILSKFIDDKDLSTSILLSDGAGSIIISGTNEEKYYSSHIKSHGQQGKILTNNMNEKLHMDGKEVYKYAVTETVKNIHELLNKNQTNIDEIKYIIPHQSNIKIIRSISNKLKIDIKKIYTNIENTGNTFCASIPIAIDEMYENKLLQNGDKVIILGYGGGLNTGSILMEV